MENCAVGKRVAVAFSGVSIALLGSMFGRAWIRSLLQFMPADSLGFGLSVNQLFDLTCGIAYLVTANVFLRRAATPVPRRALMVGAYGALVAASISLFVCHATGWAAAGVLFSLLAGSGFAYVGVAWTCLYISFGPTRAMLYTCVTQMLGELMTFVLRGYQTPYLYGAIIALPMVALGCWLVSVRRYAGPETRDLPDADAGRRPAGQLMWRPTLFLTTFTFAYSTIDSSVGVLAHYPGKFLYLVVPLLIASWLVLRPGSFSLSLICKVMCPLMACSLLLPLGFPWVPDAVSATFVGLCYNTSQLVSTFIVARLAFDYRICAPWLVGTVQMAQYLSRFMGSVGAGVTVAATGALPASLLVMMAVAVVVAVTTLITMRGVNVGIGVIGRVGGASEVGESFGRVIRVGELHGLTAREQEILYQLAQGKGVDDIAAEMVIARGTVKAHIQHIYQKTGVHKRAELDEMLRKG